MQLLRARHPAPSSGAAADIRLQPDFRRSQIPLSEEQRCDAPSMHAARPETRLTNRMRASHSGHSSGNSDSKNIPSAIGPPRAAGYAPAAPMIDVREAISPGARPDFPQVAARAAGAFRRCHAERNPASEFHVPGEDRRKYPVRFQIAWGELTSHQLCWWFIGAELRQ